MFLRILRLAKPYYHYLSGISLLILAMSGLNQVEPFITRAITDGLIGNATTPKSLSWFISLLLALLLAKLTRTVLNRISWYLSYKFSYKLKFHLKESGFAHLMSLSAEYFDKKISSHMMSKLDRGVGQITQIISNSGMFFVPNALTALITIIIVFNFKWQLGVAGLLLYVPFTLTQWWRFSHSEALERREYKLYDQQYGHFWEAISSIKLIKSFQAENFERRRLKEFYEKIRSIRDQIEGFSNKAVAGDLIVETGTWGLYAYIIFLTFHGQFTIGTMILLVQYIAMMQRPLWDLNWVFWEVKRAQIGARDYFKIIDSQASVTDPVAPKSLGKISGKIAFQDVHFGYKSSLPVLRGVTFTLEPKTITAFVGQSGAGKTTIASLVTRFYDPQSGYVDIDGIDIKDLTQKDLRQNIGLVMQETYLFADTVAENLRYGKPSATPEEMQQACRMAHADEFIDQFPKKYAALIGERGIRLSGGQKQRLSIARTLLKNPPILVLDEATSSLDSHSELLIQDALQHLMKGRTTLIIAHRLSTIQRADNIIVLKDGQVYEQGSHSKLLAADGIYAHLFKLQSGQIAELKKWDLVA